MVKKLRWPWPWPPGDHGKDPPSQKLRPVLLIPGIAGSILNAVSRDTGTVVERVWVRLLEADAEFRKRLWSRYNPETGKSEALDPTIEIQVPQDRYGLYSCDILDPDLKFRLDVVYYYHDMIAEMLTWGFVEGDTLFGFGYDFRQSNRLPETMEALRARLECMYEMNGQQKVDIITHSMGGLLVKSFMALHPNDCSRLVNKWITIATPFQGAPGFILDCLLTGVEFLKGWQKDLFIAKWSMHQLVQECPSIYEMMPPEDFSWKKPPVLRLWCQLPGQKEAKEEVYPIREWKHVLCEALEKNTMVYNGEPSPLPLSKSIVALAADTRTIWANTKLPEGVQFYNIYGRSLDTPFDTSYGTKLTPIRAMEEVLTSDAVFAYADGDGTVPIESSMADGFDAVMRVGVDNDHRGILRDSHTFNAVKSFLGIGHPDALYDPRTDCVLVPPREEIERCMLLDDAPKLVQACAEALEPWGSSGGEPGVAQALLVGGAAVAGGNGGAVGAAALTLVEQNSAGAGGIQEISMCQICYKPTCSNIRAVEISTNSKSTIEQDLVVTTVVLQQKVLCKE